MYFSTTNLYSDVVIFPKRNLLKNRIVGNVHDVRMFLESESPLITYSFV